MSIARRPFAPLALAFVLLAGLAADTSAQVLDGQWFKLRVQGRGVGLTDEVSKAKLSFTMYMFLEASPGDGGLSENTYDVTFFYEQSPGEWAQVDGGIEGGPEQLDIEGDEYMHITQSRFLDNDAGVPDAEGSFLVGFDGIWTALFKVKTDKEGGFKKATFKSLGGAIADGGLSDGAGFGGGFTVKGKSVPLSKVPFADEL